MTSLTLALVLLAPPKLDTSPERFLRWPGLRWQHYVKRAPAVETLLESPDLVAFDVNRCELVLSDSGGRKLGRRADLAARPFAVAANGRNVFAGVFLDPGSARVVDQPVAYVIGQGRRTTVRLRRRHPDAAPTSAPVDCDFASGLRRAFASRKTR